MSSSSSLTRTVCIVLTGRGEPGSGLMVVSCIILTLASYSDTMSSKEITTVNTDDSGAAVRILAENCNDTSLASE